MVVLPSERVPIARLLTFLEHGERMAHGCAQRQATLAPDPKARRFLTTQARQEAMHAVVLRGAIGLHRFISVTRPFCRHSKTIAGFSLRRLNVAIGWRVFWLNR